MAVMLVEWVFTSVFLILVVLALRAALGKRVSARLRYALWAVVLVRLLVPVQLFTSPLAGTRIFSESRMEQEVVDWPSVPTAPSNAAGDEALSPGGQGGQTVDFVTAPQAPNPPTLPDPPEPPAAPDLTRAPAWLGWAWLAGAAAAALVLLLSNLRFFWKLRRERVPLERADCPLRVYAAVGLPSSCLFGLFRPAIYVTPEAAADPDMLRHVIAHELTHYRHGDHIWSLLRCAALTVHWWNPLVWLAVVFSRRDGEMACDEGALKRLGDGERLAYGNTLLALVTAKPRPGDLLCFATTMAGEKKSLKERVSRIACAPKRILWAAVAAVLVTALACVCAFGQAAEEAEPEAEDDPAPSYAPAASAEPSAEPGQEPEETLEQLLAHFTADVEGVPEDVLRFVGKVAREKYDEYLRFLETSLLKDAGIRFDDWRVESLCEAWRGAACGMDLEVWEINYEFHTTTPEAAKSLIPEREGGPYLTEDGWLCPLSPYLTYAVFQVGEAETRDFLADTEAFGVSPESVDFPEWMGELLAKKGLVDPAKLTDVDLNRNGVPETIAISPTDYGGIGLEIWENNELIFSDEGYYAHAGWNAVFLYRDGDGQYYLLRYHPTMYQGYCNYEYQLFTLSKNGEEQTIRENSIEFDINFGPLMHQSFDPEAIAAFIEEVNVLLNHSVQLINTDENLLSAFEREGRLYDSLWFLDSFEETFVRDPSKSLLENLRDFKEAMEGQQYAENPTVFPVDELGTDILLRYQDKSTRFDVDYYWDVNFQPAEQVNIQVLDLNRDGKDEIVFPLVWGHGIGAYVEKLYVFDAETLEQYDTSGLNDMVLNSIQSTGDEDYFYLQGPGMPGPVSLNKRAPSYNPDVPVADVIGLGDIIRYTVNDGEVNCWLGCDTSGILLGYEGYLKVSLELTRAGDFRCVFCEYTGDIEY